MKKWTNQAIGHELKRQARWRLSKIETLKDDKEVAEFYNARLLKRRASYQAKNNGKGRPPKALLEFSKEKRWLLARLKIEAQLLDEMLGEVPSAPDALAALKAKSDLERSKPRDGLQGLRVAKLENLLAQFTKVPSPLSSPLPWNSRLARHYFSLLLQRQKARCRFFDRIVTLNGVERLEEDKERARLEILRWVVFSHHLASASKFASAMQLERATVPLAKPHNTAAWPKVWRGAVEEIWRNATGVFDLGGVSGW